MWPAKPTQKNKPRSIYQQLAVALYVLGSSGGGGLEQSRIALNISKGAIGIYLWHSLWVLSKLLPRYVKWPSFQERASSAEERNAGGCQKIFRDCVGFLDGSIIILRDKPQVDPEAYFSREGIWYQSASNLWLESTLYICQYGSYGSNTWFDSIKKFEPL